jgi:hypothetical protein
LEEAPTLQEEVLVLEEVLGFVVVYHVFSLYILKRGNIPYMSNGT